MKRRTCIITGASSGIGLATARALAARGMNLALICRNPDRGSEAVAHIRSHLAETASDQPAPDQPSATHPAPPPSDQTTHGSEPVLRVHIADLSSLGRVRKLASELLDTYPAIDVLINNAGLINTTRRVTDDGFEETFAVNHLAPFLLTNLLLDRMKESSPSRIINLASEAHRVSRIDFDDLNAEKRRYRAMKVYGASKRCNLLFTYELASRLEGTGVTVNAVHPGAVGSRFMQNNGRFARTLMTIGRPFLRTTDQGADTVVHTATAAELAEVSGQYFANRRPIRSKSDTYDKTRWLALWKMSEDMTGLHI